MGKKNKYSKTDPNTPKGSTTDQTQQQGSAPATSAAAAGGAGPSGQPQARQSVSGDHSGSADSRGQGQQGGRPGPQGDSRGQGQWQGQQGGRPGQQGDNRGQGQQGGRPGPQGDNRGQGQWQGQQGGRPGQQGDNRGQGQQGGRPGPQGDSRGQGQWQGQQGGRPGQQGDNRGQGQQGGRPGPQGDSRGQGQWQGQQGGRPGQQGDNRGQGQQGGRPGPQGDSRGQGHWQGQRGGSQEAGTREGHPSDNRGQRQSEGPLPSMLVPVKTGKSITRGKAGTAGTVQINYLKLDLSSMPQRAFHYDVTITPETPKKMIRLAFKQFKYLNLPNVFMAFDGNKSVYTCEKLPKDHYADDIEVSDGLSKPRKFKVVVKETENFEIDLKSLTSYHNERIFDKPMRALQCLEVVLANPCHDRGVRCGRSFYVKPEKCLSLGDGFELWYGLFQAMILGDQPFLNVDVAHKSFLSEYTLIEYMQQLKGISVDRMPDRRDLEELRSCLKGVKIVYTPPFLSTPKIHNVLDISSQTPAQIKFEFETEKMSVLDYLEKKRGYKVRYPNLPCLNVGSRDRDIFIPMELCSIKGDQLLRKKDNPEQIRNLIKYAAVSTDDRKSKIMSILQHFDHNNDPTITGFGIKIGNQFIVVPMRVLRTPKLEYSNGQFSIPRDGVWRLNNNVHFLRTVQKTHKWALLYNDNPRSRVNASLLYNFANDMRAIAKERNLLLDEKPLVQPFRDIDESLADLKRKNFDMVIVVIPFRGTSYADIKQNAELKHGILTQCIKEETLIKRSNPQTHLNIIQKINAKLNGTNHKIAQTPEMPIKNVMFIGADVTHPTPDQRTIPSVVGVAASHDAFGMCYNSVYRLQESKLENIENMDSICEYNLGMYKKNQNRYPEHIIYYRDGVSDGQFPIVKRHEIGGIRAACKKLKINPKITCIVVVKRHHTRFFPTAPYKFDRNNKFNNVSPGTVVDEVIVHPNEVQFFMVSHQSIQGTARPTRYNVIEDDAKMNIDDIQAMTYYLCHILPRCNRSISYPAPAYYAHLMASRGKAYIEGLTRYTKLAEEYRKRMVNPQFLNSNPMYFV